VAEMEGSTDLDLNNLINPCEAMKNAREERRWSKRSWKASCGEEKEGSPDKETSHKGNSASTNSFSILSNKNLMDRSASMGVIVVDNNFVAINVLTEMEVARQSLYMKSRLIENNLDVNDNLVHEDTSDEGGNILKI
jgi:hypothetical protein